MKIREARIPVEIPVIFDLFREYQQSLGLAEFFSRISERTREIARKYSLPAGTILLAQIDLKPVVGCIALRPLDPTTGELKRLYVRPETRGNDIGRALLHSILEWAEKSGYRRVVLDMLPAMRATIQLYRSLGFQETPAYITSENSDQLLYFELNF